MPEDSVLLQQYAENRDAAAFAELVNRHTRLVYGTCLRVTANAHDAEDVTQQCFLELAKRSDAVTSSVAGWLHAMALNRSKSSIRGSVTRRKHEGEAVTQHAPRGKESTWEEVSPLVDEALVELPDDLRLPLMLHYLEGKTQSDVATELDLNQSTVSRRLESGVGELRSKLKKSGVVVSITVLATMLTANTSAAAPAGLVAALGKMAIAGVGKGAVGAATGGFLGSVAGKLALVAAVGAVMGGVAVHKNTTEPAPVPAPAPIVVPTTPATTIPVIEKKEEVPLPKQINMAPPARDAGNIYARGMSAILSHVGREVSYDQVMGLSGVAFILQVETSGPIINGNELDCAWWPNDDWGFELGLPVLSKAARMEISRLGCDMQAYRADPATEYQTAFAPAIEKSLAAGKPVLSYGFIGTETDDEPLALLGYGTGGRSTRYGQKKMRIGREPWHLYVIGDEVEAASPSAVDIASLRHIIALFNEKAQGADAPPTRFSGKQAWVEWLRLLRGNKACDNNMLIHLRYNRKSAVTYLRAMAGRHTGGVKNRISAAADLYQNSLDELMKQGLPSNRVRNGEPEQTVRADYTSMVEQVASLEAEAVLELERALAVLLLPSAEASPLTGLALVGALTNGLVASYPFEGDAVDLDSRVAPNPVKDSAALVGDVASLLSGRVINSQGTPVHGAEMSSPEIAGLTAKVGPPKEYLHPLSVTGRALDDQGNVIIGAEVYLAADYPGYRRLAKSITGENGVYRFTDVPLPIEGSDASHGGDSAAFQVFGTASGHALAWSPRKYMLAQTEHSSQSRRSSGQYGTADAIELDLVFGKATGFRGRIVDDEGNPIPNARVDIRHSDSQWDQENFNEFHSIDSLDALNEKAIVPPRIKSRVTDDHGIFEFSDLPRDHRWRLDVRPSGHPSRWIWVVTNDRGESESRSKDGVIIYRQDFELVFARPREILFQVICADTGDPAEKVGVSGGTHGFLATTDAKGYATARIPNGRHRISISPRYRTPYLGTKAEIEVTDKSGDQPFVIQLPAAAILNITVLDSDTGEPLAGVDVLEGGGILGWYSWEVETWTSQYTEPRTDETGKMQVLLEPRRHSISVGMKSSALGGRKTAPYKSIDCKLGEPAEVMFSLKRALGREGNLGVSK